MNQTGRQLLALLRQQREVSHADLQRRLDVDGATVTRLVKRLESEGTVSRRLHPDDNRFTLVSLTGAGRELVDELDSVHRSFQDRLLAGIDAVDQEIVVRVLTQLRANIRAVEAAAPSEGTAG